MERKRFPAYLSLSKLKYYKWEIARKSWRRKKPVPALQVIVMVCVEKLKQKLLINCFDSAKNSQHIHEVHHFITYPQIALKSTGFINMNWSLSSSGLSWKVNVKLLYAALETLGKAVGVSIKSHRSGKEYVNKTTDL